MLTFPQIGLGYHKSVWKKKTQTPNLVIQPFELGRRQNSAFSPLGTRKEHTGGGTPFPSSASPDLAPNTAQHQEMGEASTHIVCSRGFPMKAFSGMALMLLLWNPLEGNTTSQ